MTSGEEKEIRDLRRSAELRVGDAPLQDKALPPERAQQIIHELRVYQAELEAQNDALRQARNELESSRDQYQRLYEYAPSGYLALDQAGKVRAANLTFATMLRISRDRFQGRLFSELLSPDTRPLFHAATLNSKPGSGAFQAEVRLLRDGGEPLWVLLSIEVIQETSRKTTEYWITVANIDVRKRAQASLAAANEQLDEKVRERTADLEAAKQALEARAAQLQALTFELEQTEDRERRRLAELLHDDLQQLLVGARLHIEHLAVRHGADDQETSELYGRVGQLLREATEKSRNLAYELSPPVLVNDGLCEALHWWTGQLRVKHGLQTELICDEDIEPIAQMMRDFLFRSVREMLFNVVKHADTNKAKLFLHRSGGKLTVKVADNGKGFDRETKSSRGFGLLSIQERISLLDGSLKIDSAPGGGACITLEVPVDKPPSSRGALPGEELTGGTESITRAVRIYLVDDHQVMREGLRTLFARHADIEIVGETDNGKTAIKEVAWLQPDVIIMDVSLPVMNGIETTRQIKQDWPKIRIIGFSMIDDAGARENMRAAGATKYLRKADSSDALLAAIRSD